MSVLGISLKGNEEQQEASRLIMTNDIPVVIITGAASTGKDFVTMATSLELLSQKRYSKIAYAGVGLPQVPDSRERKASAAQTALLHLRDDVHADSSDLRLHGRRKENAKSSA